MDEKEKDFLHCSNEVIVIINDNMRLNLLYLTLYVIQLLNHCHVGPNLKRIFPQSLQY